MRDTRTLLLANRPRNEFVRVSHESIWRRKVERVSLRSLTLVNDQVYLLLKLPTDTMAVFAIRRESLLVALIELRVDHVNL